jgi:hypothetical protein
MKSFEPQEYVLGPQYNRELPIWRYRKAFRSEDGEVRHLLEMPGVPGQDVVVTDGDITSIAGRRFFPHGNNVYHKPEDTVEPRYFCSVGHRGKDCSIVAARVAEFLESGGEAWSREFHAIWLAAGDP